MTVAELIEELSTLPPDAPVVIEHDGPPGARSHVEDVTYRGRARNPNIRTSSPRRDYDPHHLFNKVVVIR